MAAIIAVEPPTAPIATVHHLENAAASASIMATLSGVRRPPPLRRRDIVSIEQTNGDGNGTDRRGDGNTRG
jgi:hypothetical protein